jgi:predicted lipoprotein
MKKIKTIVYKIFILLFLGLFACDDKKKNNESLTSLAQVRLSVLRNIADNLIIHLIDELEQESEKLVQKVRDFNAQPNVEKLHELRTQWETTFTVFLKATYFEMAPVKVIPNNDLSRIIAVFPVKISDIEERITNGIFSTKNYLFSTRGLNAVEYLIYGFNQTDAEIVNSFNQSNNRKIYLDSISTNIYAQAVNYKSKWNNYFSSFRNDPSREAGSAITELFNRFIVEFERTKNDRIQLPLGQRPGQTQKFPEQVDARYSGKSLKFIKISLTQAYEIWKGKTRSGTDSTGLDDLLEETSASGSDLKAETLLSWKQVFDALNAIDSTKTLERLVSEDDPKLLAFSSKIREHTAFIKSRFTTITGIQSDNKTGDGD